MIVNKYGEGSPRLVLVHGGPGAAGSLSAMAAEYGNEVSVLEPWQTARTVYGQVEELREQIAFYADGKVLLVGHSWGAWIATLYAAKYSDTLTGVVLMGSGMFDAKYLPQLAKRREAKLPRIERREYREILVRLNVCPKEESDAWFQKLVKIMPSDDYDALPEQNLCLADGEMYGAVWGEGAAMRADGTLLAEAAKICCPITVIHGKYDPHPVHGVTRPFDKAKIRYTLFLLPRAGHSPYKERYEKENVKRILLSLIK